LGSSLRPHQQSSYRPHTHQFVHQGIPFLPSLLRACASKGPSFYW